MAEAPLCEIHTPISPTPSFFARVHVLAASVRRFAGALADSPIVVTVSRDVEPYDLAAAHPWSGPLGVEWRWVDAAVWERHGIFGTATARMTYDFRAPYVLLIDADTLCTGPLDDLLESARDGLAGVVDMLPPTYRIRYLDGRERSTPEFWVDLFAHAGLPRPRPECWHLAPNVADDPGPDDCASPPYLNGGVLVAPRAAMLAFGRRAFAELDLVHSFVESYFSCQIIVPLLLARTGVRWTELPLRWNFPNNRWIWDHYGDQVQDVRIMHYWERDEFDRERDILGTQHLDAFLGRRDLTPANRLIQQRLGWLREDLAGLPAG